MKDQHRRETEVEIEARACVRAYHNVVRDCPDLANVPQLPTVRHEGNLVVNWVYGNGPVEGLHGGHWSHGSDVPGFVRLYAGDVDRICTTAAHRTAVYLNLRGDQDTRHIALFRYLVFAPSGWSLTDETTAVTYYGMPGAGSLGPRLQWLAERYPAIYGTRG